MIPGATTDVLLHYMEDGAVNLEDCKFLIVDGADLLLTDSDIRQMVRCCPDYLQTVWISTASASPALARIPTRKNRYHIHLGSTNDVQLQASSPPLDLEKRAPSPTQSASLGLPPVAGQTSPPVAAQPVAGQRPAAELADVPVENVVQSSSSAEGTEQKSKKNGGPSSSPSTPSSLLPRYIVEVPTGSDTTKKGYYCMICKRSKKKPKFCGAAMEDALRHVEDDPAHSVKETDWATYCDGPGGVEGTMKFFEWDEKLAKLGLL